MTKTTMAKRRAPSGGYDFAEKVEYREAVWSAAERALGYAARNRHALLMPSIEGAEIEVALRHGFREDHLHVVDNNPAIVATLKRRWPRINTYGVAASEACKRIAARGVELSFANFDFTSCLGLPLIEEVKGISASGALPYGALVAITLLRGRDHAGIFRIIRRVVEQSAQPFALHEALVPKVVGSRQLTAYDAWRVFHAFGATAEWFADPVIAGVYLSPSAGQTMLWCMCRVFPRAEVDRRFDAGMRPGIADAVSGSRFHATRQGARRQRARQVRHFEAGPLASAVRHAAALRDFVNHMEASGSDFGVENDAG